MDNITHSLVGAAIAQAAIHWRLHRASTAPSRAATAPSRATSAPTPSKGTSGEKAAEASQALQTAGIAALPMMVASILANNFPDTDLFVTAFFEARLGYLLHHRGHTHTLLFAPLQLLLLLVIFWLYARWRRPGWTRSDWKWFAGLGFFGCFVHIGMDSWNVYGVHPFWPLDNRWYYGDFVFIIEPLIWLTLIPWLLAHAQQRWTRYTLWTFYGLGAVALCAVYFQMIWYPLCLVAVAFGYGYVVRTRLRPLHQSLGSLGALALVLVSLLTSSVWARGQLTQALRQSAPTEQIKDIAMMSYPSNPFCYQFIAVGYRPADGQYILRRGLYSASPTLFACPDFLQGFTAPMTPAKKPLPLRVGGVRGTLHVFQRPITELVKIAESHCWVKAVLQFVRTPYWRVNSHNLEVGDLRFDRSKSLDFADFRFPRQSSPCPSLLPPWVPPLRSMGLWKKAPRSATPARSPQKDLRP